jgi:hypothetical protein
MYETNSEIYGRHRSAPYLGDGFSGANSQCADFVSVDSAPERGTGVYLPN